MIAVIRISGLVGVPSRIRETLNRLGLRRKYSAVLLPPTTEIIKLLKKIRNYVSFGSINKETLIELIKKRGRPLKSGTKIDAEKTASQLDKKNLKDLGLKPFFRLHPPRKRIESKKHFGVGKGVLGDNKEKINDLLRRML
ncbi:MAG: uL30 family ribosomal protein [Nanoarchaeota archaeon]|nr:uL30 family ribosomal protein [Nanoarchaeota archaeon]